MSHAVRIYHVVLQPGCKHKHTVRKVKTLSRLHLLTNTFFVLLLILNLVCVLIYFYMPFTSVDVSFCNKYSQITGLDGPPWKRVCDRILLLLCESGL